MCACMFSTTALENRNVTTYFVFMCVYVQCVVCSLAVDIQCVREMYNTCAC